MTTVLVLGAQVSVWAVVAIILLVCFLSWIILRESKYLQKALRKTGTAVLERLMGVIVLVVAVQFIFNGISNYLVLF